MRRIVAMLLLLMASVLAAGCHGDQTVLVGLVDANEIDIATKVPGRVQTLLVDTGDHVEKAQEVVTINGDLIDAKMNQVEAVVDAAEAQLKMAKKGAREEQIRAAKKQMDAAAHQVEITRKMYERMKNLLEKKAIPRAKFEEFEFKYNVSQEQFGIAQAQYDAYVNGARDEQIAALAALVRRAKATKDEVEDYAKEMTQVAPITGEVAKIHLREGELAATGYPILTIVDIDHVWVTFSLREDFLHQVKKGDKVDVFVPALDKDIEMELTHLAPMADFATWRATSQKDGFDLKTFEVRLTPTRKIAGLRPGMTARWTIR
ncbi:MAG: efflux RND transporter periplasmic adaptor subunit [Candidatus Lernaella stagnicola]|nr:efflux RND transporter periplasmic adaptor subunit [Candidatus Lernaella stagnicola]